MDLSAPTLWISNALFFGACVLIVVVLATLGARLGARLLGLGLRLTRTARPVATQLTLDRRLHRVVALIATLACAGLIAAAILLTRAEIEAAPRAWTWAHAWLLHDPTAAAWLAAELLGLVLGAVLLHQILRLIAELSVAGLQRSALFAPHGAPLTLLLERLRLALRWGVLFLALRIAADLLAAPELVREPLTAIAYIALGVLFARALVVLAGIAVDVVFQAIRAFEDRKTPLRYLVRLDHLAGVTKRTLEYFCFLATATFVIHQLREGSWLAQTGLVAIRLLALVYVGRVLVAVVELVLRELLTSDRSEAENQQRLTLLPVARSILRYVVYFCIAIMALQELGVDASPILAGAGLLGLAVGLGAQTLVGDIVAGFFILFEGMFLVGDRVRIGDAIGNVEEIGIRVLKIRDEFGVLHCIPNGEVRSIANHTHLFVNAVVEFSVPYDTDVPALLAALKDRIIALRAQQPDIQGDPELVVQDLREASVLLRCLARVKPGRDDAVAEQVRGELLTALVAAGVNPQACQILKLQRSADLPHAAAPTDAPAQHAAAGLPARRTPTADEHR